MNHDHYPDVLISDVLTSITSIAVLGISPNESRPSHSVSRFLARKGYAVTGVNPGQGGKEIAGIAVVATLSDLTAPVDMIDVFRTSDALPGVADEILALAWRPKVFWCQLGVRDDAVAARLGAVGITVIQDRCPAIEIPRLRL